MVAKIVDVSKTASFLNGIFRGARSAVSVSARGSCIAGLLSETKRIFLNRPVRSASVFLFTAVSVNILLSAMLRREITPFDITIKGMILLLSSGGFFCDANWEDARKSSVILSRIFK